MRGPAGAWDTAYARHLMLPGDRNATGSVSRKNSRNALMKGLPSPTDCRGVGHPCRGRARLLTAGRGAGLYGVVRLCTIIAMRLDESRGGHCMVRTLIRGAAWDKCVHEQTSSVVSTTS